MNETADERAAAVSRMKAYIHAHLREQMTARDIADAACYSQFHAARVFRAHTGLSPFEYIRRERLTEAAHTLRSAPLRVADIALDFVFDSHEGFTRAFSRSFGIAPKQFASQPIPEGWSIPYYYLNRTRRQREETAMNDTAVIFTQIVERPARKLILKRSTAAGDYSQYVDEVGCGDHNASAPWDVLVTIREALYEPVGLWLPENMRPEGTGVYAHGVEVPADYSGAVPDGFEIIDLPPCQMMVFQGEPYDDDDFAAAVGICMNRISTYNPAVYGYAYAPERAPRMQLAPAGWRGYIEMYPVVPLT